jgi:ribosomal protein S18 acetylase RimI-like enzyme
MNKPTGHDSQKRICWVSLAGSKRQPLANRNMATLSKSLPQAQVDGKLRSFDPYRDLGAVADLIEICFANTLDADGRSYLLRMRSAASQPGFWRWATIATEYASAPLSGYVWIEDGRLVGNISLVPYYLHGKRYYLIANVAVRPEYQRRGIARALTNQAIEHIRQRRAPSAWLHVREENEPAIELYKQLGFVERTRRTTWCSIKNHAPAPTVQGLEIKATQAWNWKAMSAWLQRSYPDELTWHLPFNQHMVNPGLWGKIYRFLNNTYIQQWSAIQNGRLRATITWQPAVGASNLLWLAASERAEEALIQALLAYARQNLASSRSLSLDYPARRYEEAIQNAGFQAQQTLIWMERKPV